MTSLKWLFHEMPVPHKQNKNMANHPPTPSFCTGDFVYYHNALCIVEEVTNNLEYNEYKILSTDSGEKYTAFRHELDGCNQTVADDILPDRTVDNSSSTMSTDSSMKSTKRFAEVESDLLDELAQNRMSKKTTKMTKWGVSIFSGGCNYLRQKCLYKKIKV